MVKIMKKYIPVICCLIGSCLIGFFANKLNTMNGSLIFTLGIILLVMSCMMITKKKTFSASCYA